MPFPQLSTSRKYSDSANPSPQLRPAAIILQYTLRSPLQRYQHCQMYIYLSSYFTICLILWLPQLPTVHLSPPPFHQLFQRIFTNIQNEGIFLSYSWGRGIEFSPTAGRRGTRLTVSFSSSPFMWNCSRVFFFSPRRYCIMCSWWVSRRECNYAGLPSDKVTFWIVFYARFYWTVVMWISSWTVALGISSGLRWIFNWIVSMWISSYIISMQDFLLNCGYVKFSCTLLMWISVRKVVMWTSSCTVLILNFLNSGYVEFLQYIYCLCRFPSVQWLCGLPPVQC